MEKNTIQEPSPILTYNTKIDTFTSMSKDSYWILKTLTNSEPAVYKTDEEKFQDKLNEYYEEVI